MAKIKVGKNFNNENVLCYARVNFNFTKPWKIRPIVDKNKTKPFSRWIFDKHPLHKVA